jgi:bifunctional enzyme CysN/CysC
MLDAGMILIVTAIDLTQKELELMKTTVDSDCIHTVWVGKEPPSNIQCDIVIEDPDLMENAIALLTSAISQKGLMR